MIGWPINAQPNLTLIYFDVIINSENTDKLSVDYMQKTNCQYLESLIFCFCIFLYKLLYITLYANDEKKINKQLKKEKPTAKKIAKQKQKTQFSSWWQPKLFSFLKFIKNLMLRTTTKTM